MADCASILSSFPGEPLDSHLPKRLCMLRTELPFLSTTCVPARRHVLHQCPQVQSIDIVPHNRSTRLFAPVSWWCPFHGSGEIWWPDHQRYCLWRVGADRCSSGWRQWRRCSTEVRWRDRAMSVPGRLHHLWTYRCSAVCRRQIVYRRRRGRVRRLGYYTTRESNASSSSSCHATLPDSDRSPRQNQNQNQNNVYLVCRYRYNVKVIWKQENKLINADMEAPIKTKNDRYHRATR